jgi:hypothetical protein
MAPNPSNSLAFSPARTLLLGVLRTNFFATTGRPVPLPQRSRGEAFVVTGGVVNDSLRASAA